MKRKKSFVRKFRSQAKKGLVLAAFFLFAATSLTQLSLNPLTKISAISSAISTPVFTPISIPVSTPISTPIPFPTPSSVSTPILIPISVVVPSFSNLNATLSGNSSTFNFLYNSTTQRFRIDLSTLADMSWDVWLDFTTGTSSSLIETTPTKWDKYNCGTKLYWRVYTDDRKVYSPIQTATVDCQTDPISLSVVDFTNLSAALDGTKALFSFTPSGLATTYRVDLSLKPDMSWDTYMSFVIGSSTTLVENDPFNKWDKYNCGSTFYWRVYTDNRRFMSPIQSATVNCPTPVTLPTGTFSNFNSADLGVTVANFAFSYSDPNETDFQIDMSTLPDMSWDVYLSFAKGPSSIGPNGTKIVGTANPYDKWDKYRCGQTLYWRVWTKNRRISSPIQTAIISCAVG